jgi:hypothetical protein
MISFLSLFYLPGNEKIKIITLKHLLIWMICTGKILSVKNVELKYQKGKQMLYLFENKQKEQFFSELPLHYHTKLNSSEAVEISVASWFTWLDDVSQLLHYEMGKNHFLLLWTKFLAKEKKKLKKCEHSFQKLKKYPNASIEMFQGWFPYQNVFTFPSGYENFLQHFVSGFYILFQQIEKKEKHSFISQKIYEIFSYYKPQLEKVLLEKNQDRFEFITTDFKKEVHILLDSEFSFVNTKRINFRKWLKSIFMFDLYCEPVHFNCKKSMQTLSLLLTLYVENVAISQNSKIQLYNLQDKVLPYQVNVQEINTIHPLLRSSFTDLFLS